jgi:hypothetical protein
MPYPGLRRLSAILCLPILLLQTLVCAADSGDVFGIISTSTSTSTRTTVTSSLFTNGRTRNRNDFGNVSGLQAGDDGSGVPFNSNDDALHRQWRGLRGSQQRDRSLSYFSSPKLPPTHAPSLSPTHPPTNPPAADARLEKITSNPLSLLEPPIPPITSEPVGRASSAPKPFNSHQPYPPTNPPLLEINQPDLGIHEKDFIDESTAEPTYIDEDENANDNDDDSVLDESLDATMPPATTEPIDVAVHQQDLSEQPLPAKTGMQAVYPVITTATPTLDKGQTVDPLPATILLGQRPGYNLPEYPANTMPPATLHPRAPHKMPPASMLPGQTPGHPAIAASSLPPVTQLPVAPPLDGYDMITTGSPVQIPLQPEITATILPSATQIPVVAPGFEKPAVSAVPGQTHGSLPATNVPSQSEQISEQPAHAPNVEDIAPGQEPEHETVTATLDGLNQATAETVALATTLAPTDEATTEVVETTEQATNAEEEPTSEEPSTTQKEIKVHEPEPSEPKSEAEHSEPSLKESEGTPVASRAKSTNDEIEDLEDLEKEEEALEEELAQEEREVRRIGGFGVFLAIVAMIFTAHQMSENPDGEYFSSFSLRCP